ncbi:Fumarylacetoacetase, N-terminal [Dillenia turbinata]|uniref:Fumarylacetoacetase n=1 Tax=Dillenia turbinata TaxID=194707 RepID=A0AAN8ZFM7_9MAGN
MGMPNLYKFLALGRPAWKEARTTIQKLLSSTEPTLRDNASLREQALVPMGKVEMLVPTAIGDYTDFFSSMHHAKACGTIFFGQENPIPPNWYIKIPSLRPSSSSSPPPLLRPSLFFLSASSSSSSSPLSETFSSSPSSHAFLRPLPPGKPISLSSIFSTSPNAAAPLFAAFIIHLSYPSTVFFLFLIFSSACSNEPAGIATNSLACNIRRGSTACAEHTDLVNAESGILCCKIGNRLMVDATPSTNGTRTKVKTSRWSSNEERFKFKQKER